MKKIFSIIVIALLIVGFYFIRIYEPEETVEFSAFESSFILVETDNSLNVLAYENDEFEKLTKNEDYYIPEVALDNRDVDIDLDLSTGRVTLVNRNHLIEYDSSSNTLTIDHELVTWDKPIIIHQQGLLIDSSLLEEYFNISSEISRENNVLLIKNEAFNGFRGEIKDTGYLYKKDDTNQGMIRDLTLESKWRVISISDHWYLGYNELLEFGYIQKDKLKILNVIEPVKKEGVLNNEKIILTWDQVYSSNVGARDIEPMLGVDVISPTWFKLIDDLGNFNSFLNESYIRWAREEGYQVWPLVSNTFGDIEMTSRFLNRVSSREKLISDLLEIYKENNFKGINVDFENVYLKDRKKLTQFISELTYAFSKEDIIVSVDVTILGGSENWSQSYNHKRIGELVDYLMVMTYDEHWASSPVSGSVASYGWVKSSLEELIKIVDKNKIVMGIPLYTRIWYEEPSREKVNRMDVSSKAITMQGQNNLLRDVGLKPIWDEDARQFYLGYIEDSKVKKIWLEEEVSIKEKSKLVNELGISGVATWSRGFETNNIWEVIYSEVGD
jgi:spore germination protein YaaH